MPITRPTAARIQEMAEDFGMAFSPEEAAEYLSLMQGNFDAYDLVDALPDHVAPVKYPRVPGYRPSGEENQYNAWPYESEVKGTPGGKLDGKTVVLKDNVALAGVPMMDGAATLEGCVSVIDAAMFEDIDALLISTMPMRLPSLADLASFGDDPNVHALQTQTDWHARRPAV